MGVAIIATPFVFGLIFIANGRSISSLTYLPPLYTRTYHQISNHHRPKRYCTTFYKSRTISDPLMRRASVTPSSSISSSFLVDGNITVNKNDDDVVVVPQPQTLRMLALHGSGGTGTSLLKTLQQWNKNMNRDLQQRQEQQHQRVSNRPDENAAIVSNSKENETFDGMDSAELLSLLNITTVTGHVPKEDGFSWWELGPGERSYNADCYNGFEQSQSLVLDALLLQQEQDMPYDIIFGHSQGAILLSALLALNVITEHPTIGYIFNGVAWPNPYSLEFESVSLAMSHQRQQYPVGTKIRVLILIGERDHINPPVQAYRVVSALRNAGCDVTVIVHPNGHAIPIEYNDNIHIDSNDINPNNDEDHDIAANTTAAIKSTWVSIRHWMAEYRL